MDTRIATWLCLTVCVVGCSHARRWETKYMDHATACDYTVTHNGDMEEGDFYTLSSDKLQGHRSWQRFPAECSEAFDFGDRLASAQLMSWYCSGDIIGNPVLTIYNDCSASRRNPMMTFNCSSTVPKNLWINSTSSCLTFYHYRGVTKQGYFFELKVTAGQALISFPVAGMAAIFLLCIIGSMLCAKLFCVLTGFESRLPNINFDELEDQKQILSSSSRDPIISVVEQQQPSCKSPTLTVPPQTFLSAPLNRNVHPPDQATSSAVPTPSTAARNSLVVYPNETAQLPSHSVVRLTRSGGSTVSGASSVMMPSLEEALSDIDLDSYLETEIAAPHSRLKRYPSAKASSMFRHK